MKTLLTSLCLLLCFIAKAQNSVVTTTSLPGNIKPNKLSGKAPVNIERGDSVTLYIYFVKTNTWNAQYFETLGTVADSILVHTAAYSALKKSFVDRDHKADMIQKYGKLLGPDIADGKVKIGMTKAMVEDAYGNPDGSSRTMGNGKIQEQWTYEHTASGKTEYYIFENGKLSRMRK